MRKASSAWSELAGLGAVLGIVDHNIFAARERQRVVERLWLGARLELPARRRARTCREAGARRRGDRHDVVSLENNFDVELRRRIAYLIYYNLSALLPLAPMAKPR